MRKTRINNFGTFSTFTITYDQMTTNEVTKYAFAIFLFFLLDYEFNQTIELSYVFE